MDNLVYLIHEKFILIAVEAQFDMLSNDSRIPPIVIRKIHKLNESLVVCGVGNPFKISDINKYLFELTRLGHNRTFNDSLEALNDVFNSSSEEWQKIWDETKSIIDEASKGRDEIPTEKLLSLFDKKPAHQAVLKDFLMGTKFNQPILTQVHLLGWDSNLNRTRSAACISLGHKLHVSELDTTNDSNIYLKSGSAKIDVFSLKALEEKSLLKLQPLITENWMNTQKGIYNVIDRAKIILAEWLQATNKDSTNSDVLYYELSERTGFEFKEPDVEFQNLSFNRR